jgi:peptide chain release factor 3
MSTPAQNNTLQKEVSKRRTFAIISHPDAGKTTLTEKLLLLGGAIRLAGSVKAKKSKKFATSDWMELEKQRGISVSTSVMNFEYKGFACNLLDTPGHQDFSEDTYRTLAAADAAIMLIDAAKGVEPQTIKLFEVCKYRKIPIFTFVNKLDRDSRDFFELMEEIEKVLGMPTYPMTWPVSSGSRFKGVVSREEKALHYFEGRNTTTETVAEVVPLSNSERLAQIVPTSDLQETLEGLEMLETAGNSFSQENFQKGEISPVFFGSAMTNFGVRAFLEKFLFMCPGPSAKGSNQGLIEPMSEKFSGFIFKIQANMDPKHRDRIAFLRIVSGEYKANTMVYHSRLKREVKLSQPQQFFAQERTGTESAYAGDIVGMYDPGLFAIGDTLSEASQLEFEGIPQFAPEFFATVRTKSALQRKQMLKGLVQLGQEGTVQMFLDKTRASSDPVLAAVGSLQFDVLLFRLRSEYNVECSLETLSFKHARWTKATEAEILFAKEKTDVTVVEDLLGNTLFLFKNDFGMSYFQENCPNIPLYKSNASLNKNMMNAESLSEIDQIL